MGASSPMEGTEANAGEGVNSKIVYVNGQFAQIAKVNDVVELTPDPMLAVEGPIDQINLWDFAEDNNLFVTLAQDSLKVLFWSHEEHEHLMDLDLEGMLDEIGAVALNKRHRLLAVGSKDEILRLALSR